MGSRYLEACRTTDCGPFDRLRAKSRLYREGLAGNQTLVATPPVPCPIAS